MFALCCVVFLFPRILHVEKQGPLLSCPSVFRIFSYLETHVVNQFLFARLCP